jgi:hypothetical protein
MDRVIALFSTPGCAEQARGSLVQHGFATDQLELVSLVDRVRVRHLRDQSFAEDLLAYFHPLLRDERDWPVVDHLIDAIQHGKATLAIRPRGNVRGNLLRPMIEAHGPEQIYWRHLAEDTRVRLFGIPLAEVSG